MNILRERLLEFDLLPVETIGDGNCFFRAISRLVYGTGKQHFDVREQAVEEVRSNPIYFQEYILHEYESVDSYICAMGRNV